MPKLQEYSSLDIHNTCAVIVTFNPDNDFKERLRKIAQQFSLVVIVDNASSRNLQDELGEQPSGVCLLNNRTNMGIATGLNQGMKKAIELEYGWIVTFDQDSDVDDLLLTSLGEIYSELNDPAVIIGSNYWNINKAGMAHSCKRRNRSFMERKTVISSGMCLSRKLVEEIGFFNDRYFIDSVDHEYCLRARRRNFRVYLSCKPLMKHSIGEGKETGGWANNIVFCHSHDRVYYMVRNTLITVQEYYRTEPIWALRQILRLSIEFIAITLNSEDRHKKISAFAIGLRHAVLGRMGKIET